MTTRPLTHCGFCGKREQTTCPRRPRPRLLDIACDKDGRHRVKKKSFLRDCTVALLKGRRQPRFRKYKIRHVASDQITFLPGNAYRGPRHDGIGR